LQQSTNDRWERKMPELLDQGLPERPSRSKQNFLEWADGQAWKFVKGQDYDSSTDTFRASVRRWAKENGYGVELRPYPATDREGNPLPLSKADPVALGVVFTGNGAATGRADAVR
jgi:hypothetical protein